MAIQEQYEELKKGIEELKALVVNLPQMENELLGIKQRLSDPIQLDGPLDSITVNTITSLIAYPIVFNLKNTDPATAANYGQFYIADKAFSIVSVVEVHGTLGTDAGAVTLNLEKLTGTTAAGSGTTVLSTALSLKTTINTVQYGALKSTQGVVVLNRGDRLAAKLTGTPTAVANLVMVVYLVPFST